MAKPRVLFTTADYSPQSGAFRCFLTVVRGIEERGFEPILVLPEAAEESELLTEKERQRGIFAPLPRLRRSQSIGTYGRTAIAMWKGVRQLSQIARREGVSIVHVNEVLDVYGALAARFAGVPCVWHIRAHFDQRWAAWLFPRLVLALASHVVVASNSVAEHLFEKQGLPLRKVTTAYDPPDLGQFHPGIDGDGFRRELGVAEDAPLIVMIGKLARVKGHDRLIRAVPAVLERFPRATFAIVGGELPGEHHRAYAEELYRLVDALSLQDRVVFTGFRSDIPQVIAACDVLVHCSTYPDPFPGVVLQGMAVGKPVIATNVGGAREQIGDAGLLVPPADSAALAEALIELLGNAERRRDLGKRAIGRVSRYSNDSFFDVIVATYRQMTT